MRRAWGVSGVHPCPAPQLWSASPRLHPPREHMLALVLLRLLCGPGLPSFARCHHPAREGVGPAPRPVLPSVMLKPQLSRAPPRSLVCLVGVLVSAPRGGSKAGLAPCVSRAARTPAVAWL